MRRRLAVSILAAIPLLLAAQANAAELRVLGAGPVDGTFKQLIPVFMNATGHTVTGEFSTVGVIQDKMKKGEKADVVILTPTVMEDMEKAGAIIAGSRIEVGRGTSGFAVRAGAPVPDISTPDAVKATLLNASSVAYVDPALGATTGIHFARVLERLGIAEAINKKAVLFRRGYELADAVADGRAEIGNTNMTELMPHKGLTVVGPLPDPLALVVVYVAGVSAASPNAEAARALVAFLTTPQARASFKAAGL